MPYVPLEVKERIKREIAVQRLAEARGIQLRRSGRSLMGLCPFHKDTNPSLSIDPVRTSGTASAVPWRRRDPVGPVRRGRELQSCPSKC